MVVANLILVALGHTVVKFTSVLFVAASLLFITNEHHESMVVS
jgi:hypothetical protein